MRSISKTLLTGKHILVDGDKDVENDLVIEDSDDDNKLKGVESVGGIQ